MPDCNYCGESFGDEEVYLQHLYEAHEESELSRIDRRRVASEIDDSGGGFPTGPVILVGLVLFTLAITVYVAFFLGGGNGSAAADGLTGAIQQTPTGVGSVHEHGPIDVTIDGQELDFSRGEFQNPRENPAFHFEGGNGDIWHVHAQGVTLEYAMSTLGIRANETAVAYDGAVYRDSDPNTSVTITVNGEPVDPQTYVLDGVESTADAGQGDYVRVEVTTQ